MRLDDGALDEDLLKFGRQGPEIPSPDAAFTPTDIAISGRRARGTALWQVLPGRCSGSKDGEDAVQDRPVVRAGRVLLGEADAQSQPTLRR